MEWWHGCGMVTEVAIWLTSAYGGKDCQVGTWKLSRGLWKLNRAKFLISLALGALRFSLMICEACDGNWVPSRERVGVERFR